jgi:hypothetical protein
MHNGAASTKQLMWSSNGTVRGNNAAIHCSAHLSAAPSPDEISFVLEILDRIASPALEKAEHLLDSTNTWDSVARNDFCRCV